MPNITTSTFAEPGHSMMIEIEVRVAALEAAVKYATMFRQPNSNGTTVKWWGKDSPEEVVANARLFEQYLIGKKE